MAWCCMSEGIEGNSADWLDRANEDLRVAGLLLPHGVFNTVAYHCQLAAEMAIKAALVAHGAMPKKTHDLALLLAQAQACGARFDADLGQACRVLTPLEAVSRYPGWGQVAQAQAIAAHELAQLVVAVVCRSVARAG